MILKVQKPITTNEPHPLCLVYNQNRDILFQAPLAELDYLFGINIFKVYIEAGIRNDRGTWLLNFKHHLPTQPW